LRNTGITTLLSLGRFDKHEMLPGKRREHVETII
jgi:hypothetical protein